MSGLHRIVRHLQLRLLESIIVMANFYIIYALFNNRFDRCALILIAYFEVHFTTDSNKTVRLEPKRVSKSALILKHLLRSRTIVLLNIFLILLQRIGMVQAENEADWAINQNNPRDHSLHVHKELIREYIVV